MIGFGYLGALYATPAAKRLAETLVGLRACVQDGGDPVDQRAARVILDELCKASDGVHQRLCGIAGQMARDDLADEPECQKVVDIRDAARRRVRSMLAASLEPPGAA